MARTYIRAPDRIYSDILDYEVSDLCRLGTISDLAERERLERCAIFYLETLLAACGWCHAKHVSNLETDTICTDS